MVGSLSVRFHYLIFFFALAFYLIEPLQGYWFGGDLSKAGTNIVAAAVICMLTIVSLVSKNYRGALVDERHLFFLFFVVAWVGGVVCISLMSSEGTHDLYALLRSIILGFFVYNFSRAVPERNKVSCLYGVAFLIWSCIAVSIVVGQFSGYGLYTYAEHESGYKFFYPSLNELNFVFFSSFLVLSFFLHGLLKRLLLLAITVYVFLLLGNKSFIVIFLLACGCYFLGRAALWVRISAFSLFVAVLLFLCLSGSFSVWLYWFVDVVISFLAEYSSGAQKLAIKLSYLDPFSALISERDALFFIARDLYFNNYDLFDTLFGVGFSEYGHMYGALRGGGFSYSENDLVDLFMSYGVLGVGIFFGLCVCLYRAPAVNDDLLLLRNTLLVIFVVLGGLTGHLYLMGFPVFFFSCYLGLCSSLER